MEVDVLGGTETRTNWSMTSLTQKLSTVFKYEVVLKTTAAHNLHEDLNFHQEGGTAIMAFDYVTNYVMSRGPDPSSLGRWVTMLFTGTNGVKTRLEVTYVPGKSSHKQLHS
eukprot:12768832-Ditylum_brightwellii.AAC.1